MFSLLGSMTIGRMSEKTEDLRPGFMLFYFTRIARRHCCCSPKFGPIYCWTLPCCAIVAAITSFIFEEPTLFFRFSHHLNNNCSSSKNQLTVVRRKLPSGINLDDSEADLGVDKQHPEKSLRTFLPIMHCPALHFKIGNCCFRFFLRIHGQGQTTGGIIQVGMTETKKYLTLQIRVVQMSCERVQIVRYNVIWNDMRQQKSDQYLLATRRSWPKMMKLTRCRRQSSANHCDFFYGAFACQRGIRVQLFDILMTW